MRIPRYCLGWWVWLVWSIAQGQSLEITPPPPQTMDPGGWVNLAFRIEGGWDAEASDQDRALKWLLPPGWVMVIPPPNLPSPIQTPVVLTMTIQAPKNARAGDYTIGLMLGTTHASAQVKIKAQHTLSLAVRTEMDTRTPSWLLDAPLEALIDVRLVGNQKKAVRLEARAPDGIEVALEPNRLTLAPDDVAIATLTLTSTDPARWPMGAAIPIHIVARDEASHMPLARVSQTWRVHTHQTLGQASLSWPVMGYVQHRVRWPTQTQGQAVDWGISGQWLLAASGGGGKSSSHLAFSWATDRPWQRYLAYASDDIKIQVGHQVFGERGVARPARLAEGVALAVGDQTRFGFEVFKDSDAHYHRPWVQRGAWRYAWTHQSKPDASHRHAWSLAYQPDFKAGVDRPRYFNVQLAGSGSGLAAWVDLSYRPDPNHKVRMQFQSIPEADFSGLRAGERLRLDGVRSSSPATYRGWMVALSRDAERVMTHQLMGYIHRPVIGSVSGRLTIEHGSGVHTSSVDLSLRGRLGSMAWRSALNTQGRWQLSLRGQGLDRNRGHNHSPYRWFVHHRRSAKGTQVSRAGLEAGQHAGWHWRLGLERSQSVRASQGPATAQGIELMEPVEMEDLLATGLLGLSLEHQNTLSLSISKPVGQAGEWAWIAHQSLSDPQASAFMLRYRWHHAFKAPIRPKSALGVVHGQVRRLADSQPIVGAWVMLAGRSAQTDQHGRYRFAGIPAGQYRLELVQHHVIEDWLALHGYSQTVMVEASQVVSIHWDLVAKGALAGQIQWPADSPILGPKWRDYRLLGRCDDCPITDRQRMIGIDADGYFEVRGLSPGLWRWRLQGPPLPDAHRFNLDEAVIRIQSHRCAVLRWRIDHRLRPIEWISTEAVRVMDD